MQLGTNLSFSVKRWVEPESWARVVIEGPADRTDTT